MNPVHGLLERRSTTSTFWATAVLPKTHSRRMFPAVTNAGSDKRREVPQCHPEVHERTPVPLVQAQMVARPAADLENPPSRNVL
ncbi:hypothetical protein HanIR_Chr15g0747471 [Helianthus annuus]|nr:hypothetical protein HanIR_Chr15g0747471 [Helianthus annuus]